MVGEMHPKTAVSNLTVAIIFEHKIQSSFLNNNETRHKN